MAMTMSALHVTFLWEASQPTERMLQLYLEIETELSLAVDGADLFNAEVGDDIVNTINIFEIGPQRDGSMTKQRMENAICFCNALAEVYLIVPVERQRTFTDTMFKTGVTDALLSIMKAPLPPLKPEDSIIFSSLQMSCATLLVAIATKRADNDVTRTEHVHQQLCRQMIPVFQYMVYNSPCLATVLVLLRYLLIIGSTHKPFFLEILEEFHGVVAEFLKPGVLTTHWNSRIPARQLKLLKSLTPYMPGEINCFVNLLSWFIFEIPKRGMTEWDLDNVMSKEVLLNTYWRILNEPIPSTYFRYAKSKVMMFYAALCEEGPQYSNKLVEKFGVCPFLDTLLKDTKVDKRSIFLLSCLAKNMVICMNPLHNDNIFPMDKAMELIYEEYGKNDELIQTEVLSYIPGLKKSAQNKVATLLTEFASELRYAFHSDFMIKNETRKVKKAKSFKSVRFSASNDGIDLDSGSSDTLSIDHVTTLSRAKSESILSTSYDTQHSTLQGYLQNKYGSEYHNYLPTYANNGLYMTNKRKIFYNSLEETEHDMLAAVCTVCSAALNKIQCKACAMKYCSPACLQKDRMDHTGYCNLKSLERSLHDAVVS